MRLLFATSITFPSRYANRLQVLSMAHSLANQLGDNFWLGARRVEPPQWLRDVQIFNFWDKKRSIFLAWTYLKFARSYNITHIHSREERLLLFIMIYNQLFFRMPLQYSYEMHTKEQPLSLASRFVLKRVHHIFVLTSYMKKQICGEEGILSSKVHELPDGVDISRFDVDVDQKEAREKLSLPAEAYIVMYVGRFQTLGKKKGIEIAIEAMQYTTPQTVLVCVGGTKEEIDAYHTLATSYGVEDQVILYSYQSHEMMPYFMKAADVLIAPFPHTTHYAYYMSPLKLFEYMAAQRPIVASDLPAIREVLDESTGYLVTPGDPHAFSEAFEYLRKHATYAEAITEEARKNVEQYSWNVRAETMIQSLS